MRGWFGQSLGFEALSVRRGTWSLAVLHSRVLAVGAGVLSDGEVRAWTRNVLNFRGAGETS